MIRALLTLLTLPLRLFGLALRGLRLLWHLAVLPLRPLFGRLRPRRLARRVRRVLT